MKTEPTAKKTEPTAPPIPSPAPAVQAPTMGRIVMYRSHEGHVSPAIVNGVNDGGTIALFVFWRDGVGGKAEHSHVSESTGGEEGWFWPQRA